MEHSMDPLPKSVELLKLHSLEYRRLFHVLSLCYCDITLLAVLYTVLMILLEVIITNCESVAVRLTLANTILIRV